MGQLPPTAQILSRLQQLLSDPNSILDDVATLIRLDSAMATRVIQISNSAWFARGGSSKTIEEAVNRIGFREVYHVVAVAASSAIVAQPLAVYGRDAQSVWRESVACAFAAEAIANRVGEDSAIAYMVGLLHGIGRIAINRCLTDAAGNPTMQLSDEGFPHDHSGREFAHFGFTQAAVAACMLERWAFPVESIEPVRHQYDPLTAEEPHDRMSAVLYAARFLRSAHGADTPPAAPEEAEEIFQSLRLERDELLEFLPSLQSQVSRALQMMKG